MPMDIVMSHDRKTTTSSFARKSDYRRFSVLILASCLLAIPQIPGLAQTVDVLTYHNDNERTGQNLNETILTPANVNSTQFGLLQVLATDGKVDAQVLCAGGVS